MLNVVSLWRYNWTQIWVVCSGMYASRHKSLSFCLDKCMTYKVRIGSVVDSAGRAPGSVINKLNIINTYT